MNPSSLSTWATFIFKRVAGMSTAGRSMRLALRIRVNISANGSVIMVGSPSPARLRHAGNQPVAGHVAETDPADTKLAIHCPRPATQLAAQANADLLARQHLHLAGVLQVGLQLLHLLAKPDYLRLGRHDGLRKVQSPEKFSTLVSPQP